MRIIIALALSTTAALAQAPTAAVSLASRYTQADPWRDSWQKTAQVVSALNFSPTETVAVVEEGYPYFAPRVAAVAGRVYAVNMDSRALQGPRGSSPLFTPVVSSDGNPNISGLNLDTVMLVDIWRFLTLQNAYTLELALSMKPGSRLVILGRKLDTAFPLFSQNQPAFLQLVLGALGFKLTNQFNIIDSEYFLVFQR
jgi:hypothetical protein